VSQPAADERSSPVSQEPERRSSPRLAPAIALIILAVVCGFWAWVLVVFGVWPALILVLASAVLGALGAWQVKRNKPAGMD
jgi:hypothetical protein